MRFRPTGYELLSTARTVLREQVLPHVPADERQTIGVIEKAMALAGQKLEREVPAQPGDLEPEIPSIRRSSGGKSTCDRDK
jgi:hypothetical protein